MVKLMPVSRSRLVSAFLVLGMLLMRAMDVGAQSFAPAGVSRRVVTPESETVAVAVPTDTDRAGGRLLSVRTLLGIGGSFVGVLAGGAAGLALPRSPCNCEDPGLSQALVGAAVGSIVVAGVAAAIPELGSKYGFGRRAATGVAVSGIGAVVGATLGALTGGGRGLLGYIVGAGVGAGVGSGYFGG